MRFLLFSLAIFSITFCIAQHEQHHPAASDTAKKSIPKEVHAQVGNAHLSIHYTSPAVRGRVIWGGLVPYEHVWVTGAHMATAWETDHNLAINGKPVPAGKYAIFTIPDKEKWTVIINKKWKQHLADEYDAKEDVVRIEVIPQSLQAHQERLSYSITKNSDQEGTLSIVWEKLKITVPFQVK
ncbi:MAG: DUF2911 domain-containing protein [Bacteroidetes bacterium]|nr:DUF2911 domain-containing protein [Bacteroidota bacterium]